LDFFHFRLDRLYSVRVIYLPTVAGEKLKKGEFGLNHEGDIDQSGALLITLLASA